MKSRKIYIIGPIDQPAFLLFSTSMDELLAENVVKPIHIEICSGGGEDNAALAFYGKMMSSPAPLHIKAYGEIQSAAVLLLACGDRRSADAQVQFMVHESSEELDGSTSENLASAQRMENAENQYYGLLQMHTNTKIGVWRSMARRTTYFSSESALLFGIIDVISSSPRRAKK